jgi:hypothetical protein
MEIKSIIEPAYKYASKFAYIIYGMVLFGVYNAAPQYLSLLQSGLKYFVILFLLVRFNPVTWGTKIGFGSSQFSDFDRSIVFSAALFLATTSILTAAVITHVKTNVSQIVVAPIKNNIVLPIKQSQPVTNINDWVSTFISNM